MQSKSTLFVLLAILGFSSLNAQNVSTLINDSSRSFESILWHEDGRIYSADYNNGRLYQIYTDGTVETLVTGFANIAGGGFDQDGNLYFSALSAGAIYRLNSDNTYTLIAGGLNQPTGILHSNHPDTLYVGQYGNNSVAKVSISTGAVSQWVSNGGINGPDGLIYNDSEHILVANFNNNRIYEVDLDGNISLFASISSSGFMGYITKAGSSVYVPSIAGKRIFKINMDGSSEVLAGSGSTGNSDGVGNMASFSGPNGICSSPDGDTLLITDGSRVRMITDLNPTTSTLDIPLTKDLTISPNPVSDLLNVSFELEASNRFQWVLFNQQGQQVLQDSLGALNVGKHKIQIPITTLAPGLYHLQLIASQGKSMSYPFVKVKG